MSLAISAAAKIAGSRNSLRAHLIHYIAHDITKVMTIAAPVIRSQAVAIGGRLAAISLASAFLFAKRRHRPHRAKWPKLMHHLHHDWKYEAAGTGRNIIALTYFRAWRRSAEAPQTPVQCDVLNHDISPAHRRAIEAGSLT